jgi:ABC-type multidrug transport system fused ATPase/permease subunit
MQNYAIPSASLGERWRDQFIALKTLAPHLWPKGRSDLKLRVVVALLFLAAAKVATVYVPLFMKHAVDALSLQDKSRFATFMR